MTAQVRKYNPKGDRELGAWVQDIDRAVNHYRIEFVYIGDDAPFTLRVDRAAKPIAVACLAAVQDDGITTETGCRVTWAWLGNALRVDAIDVSGASSDEYSVTLELRR
jgi:hypothetical protein